MELHLKISEAIELKTPKAGDAQAIFQILDEHRIKLQQWLPWVNRMKSEKDVVNFLKESIAFNQGGQKLMAFVFFQNKLVGSLSLLRIDKKNKKAEMGYWLHPDMWRQGIMTSTCSGFIDFVFSNYPLNRLEIKTQPENIRSRAIPIRLRFRLEGRLREDTLLNGTFHDTEIFSLLKKDWEKI